jgi:16S rRNA processing protein RimM
MKKEFVKIGKVLKTHGFKGNLKISIESIYADDINTYKHFFIDNLPYFIDELDDDANVYYLKFEEVDTKEQAQELVGKDIFVDMSQLKPIQQKLSVGLVGYDVYNGTDFLGKVIEKIELPQQQLLNILVKNQEILIPINENFIENIDDNIKRIVLHLPENYLQTFLQ